MQSIKLIVGLGNPGPDYDQTRHNAGFWFLDTLANQQGVIFRAESKFHGECAKLVLGRYQCWLLKPTKFMNRSGLSVAALANFYRIDRTNILVVHDELDMPPGFAKLKRDGGHGGHNGLRDIIAQTGGNDFMRLRIGIGHPGDRNEVTNYVLGRPSASDEKAIVESIEDGLSVLPELLDGELEKAMHKLHS